MLSDVPVRVALPEGEIIYVFSAYVAVPYLTTHVRTSAYLE
jgi:hypothetical protein